jgi:hypothetical protein
MALAGKLVAVSAAAFWLLGILWFAGYAVGREWGPLVAPAKGSCADMVRECKRREGRLWLRENGVAECTISREERLP